MNNSKENISVDTICNKELNILIPGESVPEGVIRSYPGSKMNLTPGNPADQVRIFSKFFAPLTAALYYENSNTPAKNTLKILMASIVNVSKNLNENSFSINYQFTYNSGGNYQLNFYIFFNEGSTSVTSVGSEVNSYVSFPFEITFTQDLLSPVNGTPIPLGSIKTVQVFMVDVDPETTRGTETAVQPG